MVDELNKLQLPDDDILLDQLVVNLVKDLLCDGVWNKGREMVIVEVRIFIMIRTGRDVTEFIIKAIEMSVERSVSNTFLPSWVKIEVQLHSRLLCYKYKR